MAFYYTDSDYEVFLKFFQFLNGRSSFNYQEYLEAFASLDAYVRKSSIERPSFCSSADAFLQFLYELDVLGCMIQTDSSQEPFYSWCHRDRTTSNMAPKVRVGVRYEIHYGLMKALDLGKIFR